MERVRGGEGETGARHKVRRNIFNGVLDICTTLIVIGIGLFQLDKDINYIIFQMFLLIVFTELNSRGVSKKKIDKLKEELQVQQDIHYEDRDEIEHKGLLAQEKKNALNSKQDIEENVRL